MKEALLECSRGLTIVTIMENGKVYLPLFKSYLSLFGLFTSPQGP